MNPLLNLIDMPDEISIKESFGVLSSLDTRYMRVRGYRHLQFLLDLAGGERYKKQVCKICDQKLRAFSFVQLA